MKRHFRSSTVHLTLVVSMVLATRYTVAQSTVPLYEVHEVVLVGPAFGPTDTPARDVELVTQWRHESGRPVYTIPGFWDGDGQGSAAGNVFKVRFCPTQEGKWTLVGVTSNRSELNGRNIGHTVPCTASARAGLWLVDYQATG